MRMPELTVGETPVKISMSPSAKFSNDDSGFICEMITWCHSQAIAVNLDVPASCAASRASGPGIYVFEFHPQDAAIILNHNVWKTYIVDGMVSI